MAKISKPHNPVHGICVIIDFDNYKEIIEKSVILQTLRFKVYISWLILKELE